MGERMLWRFECLGFGKRANIWKNMTKISCSRLLVSYFLWLSMAGRNILASCFEKRVARWLSGNRMLMEAS
jgi:hypothetical protein